MSENRSIFPASRSVETGNRDVGRDSFDPQVERSVPSAPIDGSIFTNSFLRKVKSTGAGRGESVKSPGSSKVSDSPSPAPKEGNTAMAMLSPVLSRVREKHRQAEMQLLAGAWPFCLSVHCLLTSYGLCFTVNHYFAMPSRTFRRRVLPSTQVYYYRKSQASPFLGLHHR